MIEVIALLGSKALWLTYAWLASAIVASFLSARKGYGERPGLATGLMLTVFGVIVWLLVPAKPDSRWKLQGPLGRKGGGKSLAELRAESGAAGSSAGTRTQPAPPGTGTGRGQAAAGDPGATTGRGKG